ncbi:hypothetical protein ACQPZQ_25060 [Pseudonocardia sp. CA-142604]|uniref:hypothetical protein n=1 Tax=Pseudonocardia sp. CA-142604 TaxID=3240024 RepID=UPI003D8DD7CE
MPARITWRRELLAAGFAAGEVRQQVRVGALVSVRRGAYLTGALPPDPELRHVILVRAALSDLAADAVVSHASAAVVLGLPLWNVPLGHVHVTRCRRSGARRSSGAHVHAAPLEPDEIVEVDGLRLTSPARTVVDLARWLPFEQAVVAADGALRLELVTRAGLAEAVERAARRSGSPAARRVVAFADERSESPGESRSRVALQNAGLPRPVLQWEVHGASASSAGRGTSWTTSIPWPSGSCVRSGPRNPPRSTCGDLAARRLAATMHDGLRRRMRRTTDATTPPDGRSRQGAPGRRYAAGINPLGSSTYLRAAPWSNSW